MSMNQIAARVNTLGFVDDIEYRRNSDEVMRVIGSIQQEYAKLIGNH